MGRSSCVSCLLGLQCGLVGGEGALARAQLVDRDGDVTNSALPVDRAREGAVLVSREELADPRGVLARIHVGLDRLGGELCLARHDPLARQGDLLVEPCDRRLASLLGFGVGLVLLLVPADGELFFGELLGHLDRL